MEIIKEKTVAFTGNRTLLHSEVYLRTKLYSHLEKCYHSGKRCFISGMAVGWDMLAAEEVLRLKIKYPDIMLVAAIPFMGQELMYQDADRQRYKAIYESADHLEFITDSNYSTIAYHKRNDWMIANCDQMIAYNSGNNSRSGTSSTIRKARVQGVKIHNLYP